MFFKIRVFFLSCVMLFSLHAVARADLIPAAPTINAKAYLLMDYHSGKILTQSHEDDRVEPASLTKMMTSYVIMSELKAGAIKMDDKVLISEKAWRMGGSRMFVEVGKRVELDKLILGMIVDSGNDATVALAEHTAGSEDSFVTLMNKYAEKLGMKHTHFANATGWPNPEHYTTAHDLAILTRALIKDFPDHYDLYKIKQFTYNKIPQFNRNRLLWLDDRVDGVKTGHTESAGFCLVASAQKDDMRLISVVLGTSSENARESESRKLLNYGFRFFETFKLHAALDPLTQMRVWKGNKEEVPLGLAQSLYITTPRGRRDMIKAQMTVDSTIVAPIVKGHEYGHVDVKLGDEVIAERPLIALEDVAEGGFWRRTIDNIKLLFQ
ncbi:MAG: serine-type D-Ala-D-Ala carboxypeptidase [Gammaproteobacteria bacterium]|nr:serine-type D-Ala-D-Ala carboxypeptidase [Gammaproteobacteria bacterium]